MNLQVGDDQFPQNFAVLDWVLTHTGPLRTEATSMHLEGGQMIIRERLSASDALHHGLVNEVVDFGALEAVALQWCQRLLAASPLAVQAAKEAALSRLDHPLPIALASRFEAIEQY